MSTETTDSKPTSRCAFSQHSLHGNVLSAFCDFLTGGRSEEERCKHAESVRAHPYAIPMIF